MAEKGLFINKFNGGISTGSKIGYSGSFRFGRGLDIHSDPDVLKISPACTKISGSVVTDLIVAGSTNTVNSNIYFLGDTGNVYKNGTSLLNNYTSGQGMGFFSGTNKVYFTANDKEYLLNPANDSISQERELTEANWHPVEAFLDKVFIGNGRELISRDSSDIEYDSTTTGGGITIDYNYEIKCIKNLGDWLFVGATSSNSSFARYFIWDGVSDDYNYAKTLKGEDGINSVEVGDDGTIIISAGKSGNLYQLVGLDSSLTRVKTIPYIEKDKTIEVYPQAMANYRGRILIGLSAGTSVTAEGGVYEWASTDINYPKVLNMPFVISTGNTLTARVGCIISANTNDLYIGWKDGTSYGIDKVDGTLKQPTASIETLIHDADQPYRRKLYNNFKVNLASTLATGEVVTLYYKKDRGAWTSIGTLDYSVDGAITEKRFKPDIKAKELEIKLEFAGTTQPDTDSVLVIYSEEALI